jgi:hypothetical protein
MFALEQLKMLQKTEFSECSQLLQFSSNIFSCLLCNICILVENRARVKGQRKTERNCIFSED